MKTKSMKVIILLLASIIVAILGFIQKYSLERLSYTMLVVVVLFYIIGTIIQNTIDKTIKNAKAAEEKTVAKIEVPKQNITPVLEKNNQTNIVEQNIIVDEDDE